MNEKNRGKNKEKKEKLIPFFPLQRIRWSGISRYDVVQKQRQPKAVLQNGNHGNNMATTASLFKR